LQTLSNILERAVHFQLYDYLNIKHFLTDKQFGFRAKHETVTALASFADGVLSNMERGNLLGSCILGFVKGFRNCGSLYPAHQVIFLGMIS